MLKRGLAVEQRIQVTYASEDRDEIGKREAEALLKVSSEFKCKNLTIITWDYEGELALTVENKHKQINCIPLWKWLIKKIENKLLTQINTDEKSCALKNSPPCQPAKEKIRVNLCLK